MQLNNINIEKIQVHLVDELDLALVAACLDRALLPIIFTAATSRLCSRRPLVPTVSVHGGLLPTVLTVASCRLYRVHGGFQPTVFTVASCRLCSRRQPADCVHGGLLPTVFTAAPSRLCSWRPLVPTVFTAASCRLYSQRPLADCVRGGLLCRLCSRRPASTVTAASCRVCSRRPLVPTVFTTASCRLCSRRHPADCVHGGVLPTVFAAASCAKLAAATTLCLVWDERKGRRLIRFRGC